MQEIDYVKESVFGVSGVASIMAKDQAALQDPFKTRTGDLQSPLLCLLLAYLTFFVAVALFFRTKDTRVASRTDKFFDKAFHTLVGVQDKEVSAYLNRKATVWNRRFPRVHSPDHIDDTKEARDAEGPKEEDAGNADDADVSRPMLFDDEDENESDGRGKV